MKKYLIGILAVLALASCGQKKGLPLIPEKNFADSLAGREVKLYTLHRGDITLQVTNYGARVVSLFTPDREGKFADIVAGHKTLAEYVNPTGERYLGACVGPVANRIGGASFEIDGELFETPKNDNGVNTLHGGEFGLDKVVWDVFTYSSDTIIFEYDRPDGQDGFPGNLHVTLLYMLNEHNELVIRYLANTDKVTPVNLSHHSFFNLAGEDAGSIEGHLMWIDADAYTPIDSLSIPTGEILPVEDTPFDFRQEHAIGEMLAAADPQVACANGYDHTWVLNGEAGTLREVVTVYEPESGRMLTVSTDQPGMQMYSGNFFDGATTIGKRGKPLGFRSSFVLEAQKFPDSMNHPDFTDILLYPDEDYTQTTVYEFSVR